MPLDVLGRTRATMGGTASSCPAPKGVGNLVKAVSRMGQGIGSVSLERGIPRRRSSSNCTDYVPALCTHRPSLFPMNGLARRLDWRPRDLVR